MPSYVVVLVTCASKLDAQKLAQIVLEKRLAACISIVDCVESFFRWQSQVDHAQECLLILKTQDKHLDDLTKLIKLHHSYELPPIIALPIIGGCTDYLNWIQQETE
jgi:periplasmic divalent cation tolerance protein